MTYGKAWAVITSVVLSVSLLSGCATSKKMTTIQRIEQLDMKVDEVEKRLQQKDEEIWDIKDEIAATRDAIKKVRESAKKLPGRTESSVSASEKKSTAKNIQSALQNAGYYNGAIDGKVGKMTRYAIKEFQRANGLNPDGIVGKKTWAKLQEHLN